MNDPISSMRQVLRDFHIKGAHRLIKYFSSGTRIASSGFGAVFNFDFDQPNELYSFYFMGDDQYIRFWRNLLEPNDVFVDVGANVGYYSCHVSGSVRPSGLVVALEPNPATLKRLQENIRLNGADNILVLERAAGEYARKDVLLAASEHGLSRLENIAGNTYGIDAVQMKHDVSVIALDSLSEIWRKRRVRGLKIDIEGAELSALRGAKDLIRSHRPVIQMEVNSNLMREFGYKLADLIGFLCEFDYIAFVIESPKGFMMWNKRDVVLKSIGVRDNASLRPVDLIACHRHDGEFVLDKWSSRFSTSE